MSKKKVKLRPFQMYVNPDLYDNVKQLADKKGMSFSAYVREAVEKGLQREKNEREEIMRKIRALQGNVLVDIDLNISRKKR